MQILDFPDKSVTYATFINDIATTVVRMMSESSKDPDMISQRQAFAMFGRANVERWRKQGKIEPCKRPGKIEYRTADLKQLVALKGKITLQERNVAKYLASKQGELFFDKENDAMLQKILAKVERAKQNVAEAEQRLADKVEQYQKEQQ